MPRRSLFRGGDGSGRRLWERSGEDGETVQVLLHLKESYYWQVRDAALKGLKRMLDRGVAGPTAELLRDVSCFILTSTDFRPYFSIKETYRTIRSCCVKMPPVQEKPGVDGGGGGAAAERK